MYFYKPPNTSCSSFLLIFRKQYHNLLIVNESDPPTKVSCGIFSCSVLYLSNDSVRIGQPGDAHAIHGSASVGWRTKLFFFYSLPEFSKNHERALHSGSFIIT